MLMSHTSSLTDEAGYILPLDGNLAAILADPKAWDTRHAPGTYFRYANFNSPVIAAVMEAATNERFDTLMARLVLSPLRLNACYNWGSGCSAGRRAQAAVLLRPDGALAKDGPVAANQSDCNFVLASDGSCDISLYRLGQNGSAFSPQGGLRISAHDLVRVGQAMLNNGQPILSPASFAEMTKPAWQFDGSNGDDDNGYFKAYGLGFQIIEQKGGAKWIGHMGEAYGLRAGFWLNPSSGKGRLQYVTMVDELAPVGHCFDSCP
jgi:CubicO group peptidase (beta-lactamase class C family)